MKLHYLATMLAAGTFALTGAALAQSSMDRSPAERSPGGSATSPSSPGGSAQTPSTRSPGMSAPGTTGSTASKPATPPQTLEGKEIKNAEGDTVGDVETVQGNQLIVSVGGFLGIGDRKVALDWDQVTMTGSGDDAKLMTSMTKEQLKALPEYTAEKSGSSGTSGSSGAGSKGGSYGGSSR